MPPAWPRAPCGGSVRAGLCLQWDCCRWRPSAARAGPWAAWTVWLTCWGLQEGGCGLGLLGQAAVGQGAWQLEGGLLKLLPFAVGPWGLG